jgi:hypothetical protein
MYADRKTELMLSRILQETRPVVHATDAWVKANGGRLPFHKRRGVLIGIRNGAFRVIVGENKNPTSFHQSFWRLP